MERAYTVREVDELRQAVEHRWLYGTTRQSPGTTVSRVFKSEEKEKCVEELLRTHMIAGHTAQDLYDADRGTSAE